MHEKIAELESKLEEHNRKHGFYPQELVDKLLAFAKHLADGYKILE